MTLSTSALGVDHDLDFTDIFCGAGGSSIGLTAAGYTLRLAANHWDRAIETHAANFADADHLCADVNNYDMRRLPRTRVLWASPICTEISPAGGNKKQHNSGQLDLLAEGPIASAAYERTRATFHDVIRATEVHRYDAVIVENVTDVAFKWELFDWWCEGVKLLGYNAQFVSVSSAHVGGEGNPHAPQWRDRLYICFTRTGVPLPDLRPRPSALCQACDEIVPAIQAWKDPRKRKIGKYGAQYVYRCPNARCRHAVVEPYVLPAAAAIDWSDIGTRIGDRAERGMPELKQSTLRRIQAGLDLFSSPQAAEAFLTLLRSGRDRTIRPGERPLATVVANGSNHALVSPFTVPSGGTWRTDPDPVATPMAARTTRETDGLVTPFMVSTNHDDGGRQYPVDAAPLCTRSTKIGDGMVCAPFVPTLRNHATATGVDEPLTTVAAGGNHHGLAVPPGGFAAARPTTSLVIPYRRGAAPYPAEAGPLSTVATRETHGVLRPEVAIEDCCFRMLQPREHLRAQRFPDAYIVTGNKGEQTMQAGNAVSSNVAQWLGQQIAQVLL
ncbi:DNA cytosine methyltransferase [Solihabitans fulvus]|uniref:DNA (cytosine-5-)-methyltransferase n=1 Tax=Solihabitans fulvus TaxID=1892852 RepID=A0A5B2W9N3_9PSEU|nr:DNA cytosine methyltransferase [Solihabitans fulvus]KAA2247182.1 DNA cytosine methyltransferase [Solihabitans fulvus]